ncbi:MAG: redoxin domain-containing protein [Fibromonadales bacterium]|nr:redoxin domain-containing protein [Fibromonadales bacterium]
MNFHDFVVKDIKGEDYPLSNCKGKKVLVVNTASRCKYTPQYAGLQMLYDRYKDKNFTIIAFPANNFGAQEPYSNEEIAGSCSVNYGISFPLMAKISVEGPDAIPLFKWLTNKAENGVASVGIGWNFRKFLIDENGRWIKSLPSNVSPDSEEIVEWIEQ